MRPGILCVRHYRRISDGHFSQISGENNLQCAKIKALRFFVARKRLQESKAGNRNKKSCRMQLQIKVRPLGRTTGGTWSQENNDKAA